MLIMSDNRGLSVRDEFFGSVGIDIQGSVFDCGTVGDICSIFFVVGFFLFGLSCLKLMRLEEKILVTVIRKMTEKVLSLEKGYLVGYCRVVDLFVGLNGGLLSVDNILGFVHGCIVVVVVGVG